MTDVKTDILFAGGGLASCLTALRLAAEHPGCGITIVEAAAGICGNHTWSFHGTDFDAEDLAFLEPMVAHRWPGQKVVFPGYGRELTTPYYSLTAESVGARVRETAAIAVRTGCEIRSFDRQEAILSTGDRLRATCVIDGRGFRQSQALTLAFQKFVGLEVELAEPHGERVPTIMDASVEQIDGYRFVYLLPMGDDVVMIEDTRYSDGDHQDDSVIIADIEAFAEMRGWQIKRVRRRERGILPISLAHDFERFWSEVDPLVAPIGLRAGLFHPTTGYSLPNAVALGKRIAALPAPLTTEGVRRSVHEFASRQIRHQRFYRFLNRMLFRAARPRERRAIMERFYSLPQGLIERFYADRLRWTDKMRILSGKPPIPVGRAMKVIRSTEPAWTG